MLELNNSNTALVLIDLQKGIASNPSLAPRSGDDVVNGAKKLAENFRSNAAHVVMVHVKFAADGGDALKQQVDKPRPRPEGGYPANWSDFVEDLTKPSDIIVAKHQWGAFFCTDLDVQLRRRGIKTIVIGGIATNMGVESTVRQAWEYGYEVVVVEDICGSLSTEMHDFAIKNVFPMISRVVKMSDISLKKV